MLLDPAREKRFEFGLCSRRDVRISISSFADLVIGAVADHIDHVVGVAQALGRDRLDIAVEHNIGGEIQMLFVRSEEIRAVLINWLMYWGIPFRVLP